MILFFTVIILAVIFTPCYSDDFDPSHIPGDTVADNVLKVNILTMLYASEGSRLSKCKEHKIIDTKFLGWEGNIVLEEWTVSSCSEVITYKIKLIPSPAGGVDIVLTIPEKEQNNGQELLKGN